jgi:hypothetical protein
MAKNKKYWPYLLLSYVFPLIGGLITYFVEKKDKAFAKFCLYASSLIFVLIIFISLFMRDPNFNTNPNLLYLISAGAIYICYRIMSKNKYDPIMASFLFFIPGTIYAAYFSRFKNDKNMKNNLGNFLIFQFILIPIQYIFISFILF